MRQSFLIKSYMETVNNPFCGVQQKFTRHDLCHDASRSCHTEIHNLMEHMDEA